MKKQNIAKKAAAAYFGFSKNLDDLPKSIVVNVYEHCNTNPQNTGFLQELNTKINEIWNNNIGSYSRTARLSKLDFLWYVNMLRSEHGAEELNESSELIELWMKNIVDLNEDIVLVDILHLNEHKLLLVNTKITL